MSEPKSRRILGFPDVFWIGFVIMIGVFLKLVYNVTAGYEVYTHNLGQWAEIVNDIPNGGHLGVLQYYYTYGHLPNFDPTLIAGYTNPPLFYWIGALVLKIFHDGMGWNLGSVLHCIQCLNFVYVLAGMFAGVGIIQKMGVKGRKHVMLLLFLMFYPGLYNLGAGLENTPLAFMFAMLSMNMALKWYEGRKRGSLIGSAITLGLAMMTKLSAGVVLFPIVVLFLMARFYDRRSTKSSFYANIGIFAAVSLPLGLWYPIRNLIKFGTSLFYVMPETELWQDVSTYSAAQRLGLPSFSELFQLHQTTSTYYEYNIIAQTFKTTVADENALNLSTAGPLLLSRLLVLILLIFTVLALVMLIYALAGPRMSLEKKLFTLTGLGTSVLFYIIHCFRNPTVSAMNFREIPFAIFFLCIGVGMCGNATEQDNLFEKAATALSHVLIVVIALMSAFLFGFYAI